MSEFHIKNLSVVTDGKQVVEGASLVLKESEVHVLMGPNGSGKSSLLNAIMGHPKYTIKEGGISFDGVDITNLATEKKAQAGIFLSLQHLPEIPGVTLTNFLHKAYRARNVRSDQKIQGPEKIQGLAFPKLPLRPDLEFSGTSDITPLAWPEPLERGEGPLDFYKMMEARAKEFGIDAGFLKKHLNAGLSGGEKKLSEVLQLLALEPKFALLDEIDSGVDVDALKKVFAVIEHLRAKGVGFLLVSHHPNLLQHIKPDHVHVMKEGKIVASGGKELVEKISREGFDGM
ncbi:MAG: ABC transporter ATP-binding protein [bacterium]|nr:ABC transporter ATP-binding protein [bacterium]